MSAASNDTRPVGRVPEWWRDLAGIGTWALVQSCVLLWVADQGVQGLTDLGGVLTGLGRLTGLLAAALLVLQLLAMARIPFVEQAFGQDDLVRRHRGIGYAMAVTLTLHIALITGGYAVQAHLDVAREFVQLVRGTTSMWAAVAAVVCFVLVVNTSARTVRSLVPYETWHQLHLYAYLGIALSIPHETALGLDLMSQPVRAAVWWGVYGVSAAALVVWRVLVPLLRSSRHRLRVDRVVPEADGVVSVYVTGRDLERLPVRGGQYFTWRFLAGAGWTRGHPYSLSAAPHDGELRITVKALGRGSRRLARLSPGTRVIIEGPYGRLHRGTLASRQRRVTLVASGIGITPVRALLEDFATSATEITLIYRASRAEELVFRDEIDAIAARCHAQVHYLLGPRIRTRPSWLPETSAGLSDHAALVSYAPQIANSDVYICGAGPWMHAVRRAARAAKVPARQIHLESFGW